MLPFAYEGGLEALGISYKQETLGSSIPQPLTSELWDLENYR